MVIADGALIDDGTYVLIINLQDETYEGTLASANEVRSRGSEDSRRL